MMIDLYNQSGEIIGKVDLPDDVFGLKPNFDLMHQAFVAQISNSRKVLAHTKDRSEVRGGGKKPWKQKGTGRARHGSIRSPLWRGGGITFGPTKERNFSLGINKKMKRKALFLSLSGKSADKQLMVLDSLILTELKTKKMEQVLNVLTAKLDSYKAGAKKRDSLLLVLSQKGQEVIRATRNLSFIKLLGAKDLNLFDVLSHKFLLMDQGSISVIREVFKI